jgi:alanine-synthesizing transaminase
MGLGDGFYRIKRLPPYVFAQVQSLKLEARQQGEDIIDFGMGNPDQPTPSHIVEKMIEAARKGKNHRYSASRGSGITMSSWILKPRPSSRSALKKGWRIWRWP